MATFTSQQVYALMRDCNVSPSDFKEQMEAMNLASPSTTSWRQRVLSPGVGPFSSPSSVRSRLSRASKGSRGSRASEGSRGSNSSEDGGDPSDDDGKQKKKKRHHSKDEVSRLATEINKKFMQSEKM